MLKTLSRATHVVLVTLTLAAPAMADPLAGSALPWIVQGRGAVARAGSTLFFGGAYSAMPRANQSRGFAVFSAGEAVGEPADALGPGSEVSAIASDGAGGWYLGGRFTVVGGLPRRGLAHVLASGRVDPAFVADLSVSAVVSALVVDGPRLIVGGYFTTVNLVPRNHLAYLNAATGQVLPTAPVVDGPVGALVTRGSSLFVGGGFTKVGGLPRSGLAALDLATGNLIPGFVANLNSNGFVRALATDGVALYVGGGLTSINGTTRHALAKMDPATGFLDPAWHPLSEASPNALAVANGVVYVGGRFQLIGGQLRANLAALSATTGATTGWRADTDGPVSGLVERDGALYVVGEFKLVNGLPRWRAAAIATTSPATVLPWNPSFSDRVNTVGQGAGRVAVGGGFEGWGAIERRGLAAIDAVSGDLLPFAPDLESAFLYDMVADSGRLIVTGDFLRVNGVGRPGLAAFNLNTYTLLPLVVATDGYVFALAVDNGVLYLGGEFTTVNGAFRLNLAAIDLASGQLLPWAPQADGYVAEIVTHGTGVYVGGIFTSLIGTNGFHLRTSVGAISSAGAVLPFDAQILTGRVDTMALSGSSLFLGGTFQSLQGAARARAAAVQVPSGALLPWNPMLNAGPLELSVNRGFVYLGGYFTSAGGALRRAVARVNDTDGAVSPWQTTLEADDIHALEAFDDGVLLSVSSGALGREHGIFLSEQALGGLPGPPTLPSVRLTAASLALAWEPPILGPRPASYVLRAGTAPGLANLGTLPVSGTSFAVGGVPPGTYYARLHAVGAAGVGAASDEVVFTVGAGQCTAPPPRPDPPTVSVAGSSVVLNWRAAPGAPPDAFTMSIGTSSGLGNLGTVALGPATTFATSGVPAGTYFVRLVATNACGRSIPSADATVAVGGLGGPPGAPLHLRGTAGGGVVALSWFSPSGTAATAHVLEAGSGPALANLATVTLGPATSFSTSGVPPGTYYLRVRALNATGASPRSGELVLVVP